MIAFVEPRGTTWPTNATTMPPRVIASTSSARSSSSSVISLRALHDLADRLARSCVDFLDDLGRDLVADVRVERGADRRRRLRVLLHRSTFGFDAVDALVGEHASTRSVSKRIDSSRLRAISGTNTFSSKLPCEPGERDRGVVADHLRADLGDDLGDHRVHLARHDRRAGLQVGQADLGEPGARAAAHPAQVVGDLEQRHRERAQLAARLDERVARALRGEVVLRFGERQTGARRRGARSPCLAKPFGALMPVPTAVPPSGSAHSRGSASREPGDAVLDLRGVAAELLAERDRASRPSGACGPHFTTCANSRCFLRSAFDELLARPGSARRRSPIAAARCTADGNTSFDDCDAFTWSFGMHRLVERVGRKARDHLVRVHVRRRARAGLEHVDREVVVELARRDLVGRRRDRVADRLRRPAGRRAARVHRAASRLDQRERADRARARSGSPEIGKFSTARWVCAPQCASAGTRTSPIESCSTR